jgi:hypothetical protein
MLSHLVTAAKYYTRSQGHPFLSRMAYASIWRITGGGKTVLS